MSEKSVQLKNPVTNEVKTVKTGWSWSCFLFSWIYGIPLFLRGLNVWGGVMLFLMLESHLTSIWVEKDDKVLENTLLVLEILITLAFSIWFGVKANLMAIRNYLEKRWVFIEPKNASVERVKEKLNILDK